MNNDNKNKNDQSPEEQQPSDETQTELREISKEELKQILEDHKKWLESEGKEGERADLENASLQKASLYGANLQEANLFGTNLQQAVFLGANLQQANLNHANLKQAILNHANLEQAHLREADMQKAVLDGVTGLSEADLQYANLVGATGFLGNEFAQSDLTGTKLPKNIEEFKALETVKETSQNARKIFFAMLLGCVYSWLTIATTTDVRLLTNTASSPLPIIGTEIPIVGFYIAAPLVLICLYFYFHLYLLKLWEGLSGLPAIFPDGKRLDERAYPWLLNGLVRRHFKRLKAGRPFISHIQEWITIFLAWWVVPITMIAFWLRFIPRHDWVGTTFHIGLIVVSVASAIIFYRLCALTMQGKEKTVFRLQKFWSDRRFYYGASVVMIAFLFSLLSYGSIEGIKPPWIYEDREVNFSRINEAIPWAFDKLGYEVFADFSEMTVSEKPANYWLIPEHNQLNSVKGANLRKRDLKDANMIRAFLVKADLRYANLSKASFIGASLQQAKLYMANLKGARLWNANLEQAKIGGPNSDLSKDFGTNLEGADLLKANLQQADLSYADLHLARLQMANLQQAIIKDANLQRANLLFADLQRANLEGAYLQEADLKGAKLQHANLKGAKLQQAQLDDANLRGCNLEKAYRSAENNLTIEQLSKVKTLYKAKLDPELLEQVKNCCPHLLEEPKEEPDKSN